jgi:hypothetical protein
MAVDPGTSPSGDYNPDSAGAASSSPYAGASYSWTQFDSALWGGSLYDANIAVETDRQPNNMDTGLLNRGNVPFDKQPKYPVTAPLGSIVQQLSAYKPDVLTRLQAKLQASGFISPNARIQWGLPDDATRAGFTNLLVTTGRLTQSGVDKTWQEVLADAVVSGKKANAPSTHTTTSVLNEQQAHAAFEQTFRESVGRLPTDAETARFRDAFNSAAAENPEVSTTTTNSAGNSHTTQSGGFDARQMAVDTARENPDYANYQAVATYFPLMQRLLEQTTDVNTIGVK